MMILECKRSEDPTVKLGASTWYVLYVTSSTWYILYVTSLNENLPETTIHEMVIYLKVSKFSRRHIFTSLAKLTY